MTVIYVAPEELEAVARGMSEAADEVEHCGRELMRAAVDAPSYEGQYGPWLEAMAVADDHDTRLTAEEIRERAHNLLSTAGAFRDADALDALGHVAWAATVWRLVEADYDPTGLVADWLRGPGRPPQIALNEWNQLTEGERQAILEGAWNPQWLWAHPAALAAVLTDDREGQEYLEQTALPQLSNSPTGRAVIEALLEHAPVKMLIIPEFARDISEWVQTHTGKGLPNLQPFGRLVIMYSPSQPGHIFAHEAIHLMARQTGVDPWSIAGGIGRPGFSLQMEREAMIVESTIKFELETRATERQLISEDIRVLTNLQDHQAAFAKVDELGGQVYGWFPEGNTPVRDWRADLLDLGLGQETIVAIVEAAWSGPRP
ncbi:MAG TPA: hypothetical protein VIH26_01830 [Anaerolineales bacterium]